MTKLSQQSDSAVCRGIKLVGIGKKGSRHLPLDLANEILNEIQTKKVSNAAIGAFYGALWIKGFVADEEILQNYYPNHSFDSPKRFISHFSQKTPEDIKQICIKLLQKDTLSRHEAHRLGNYLFLDSAEDNIFGLVASILRVRYETIDEYAGLLQSMQDTFSSNFTKSISTIEPIIQFAEPFDGVDHSNMITPLISKYFNENGYQAVSLVGRNSGPKNGNNLYDLAKSLDAVFIKKTNDFKNQKPLLGWYLHQGDLSKPMDRWVDIRRQIIKRPFLATLERFVNPFNARIVVASAFHPPYGEKMLNICEEAGYQSAIIIRNGIEGSIAFPLMRTTKILCTKKEKGNKYRRFEIGFDAQNFLNEKIKKEEKVNNPSLDDNIKLIKQYMDNGKSDNALFDMRIKATCEGLKHAVKWIESNEPKTV